MQALVGILLILNRLLAARVILVARELRLSRLLVAGLAEGLLVNDVVDQSISLVLFINFNLSIQDFDGGQRF